MLLQLAVELLDAAVKLLHRAVKRIDFAGDAHGLHQEDAPVLMVRRRKPGLERRQPLPAWCRRQCAKCRLQILLGRRALVQPKARGHVGDRAADAAAQAHGVLDVLVCQPAQGVERPGRVVGRNAHLGVALQAVQAGLHEPALLGTARKGCHELPDFLLQLLAASRPLAVDPGNGGDEVLLGLPCLGRFGQARFQGGPLMLFPKAPFLHALDEGANGAQFGLDLFNLAVNGGELGRVDPVGHKRFISLAVIPGQLLGQLGFLAGHGRIDPLDLSIALQLARLALLRMQGAHLGGFGASGLVKPLERFPGIVQRHPGAFQALPGCGQCFCPAHLQLPFGLFQFRRGRLRLVPGLLRVLLVQLAGLLGCNACVVRLGQAGAGLPEQLACFLHTRLPPLDVELCAAYIGGRMRLQALEIERQAVQRALRFGQPRRQVGAPEHIAAQDLGDVPRPERMLLPQKMQECSFDRRQFEAFGIEFGLCLIKLPAGCGHFAFPVQERLQRLALKIVQRAALLVNHAGGLPRRVQRIAFALDQGGDGGIGRGMLHAALAAAVLAVGGLDGLVQRRARCCQLRLNQLLGRILRCFQLGQIELARLRGLVSAGLLTLAKAVLRILFDLLEPLVAPGDVRLRAKQGLAPGFQKRPLAAQRRRLAHPRVQRIDAFLRISLGLALELACLLLGKFGLALRGSFFGGDLLALLLNPFFLFLRLFLDLAHCSRCLIGLLVQVQAQAAVLSANVAQRQFGRLQLAFGEFSRLHPGLQGHDGGIGFVAPGPVFDLAPVAGNGV